MSLTKHFFFIILLSTLQLCGLCSVYLLSALECIAQDEGYAVASCRIIIIIIIIQYVCLLSQAFLPGTSLEPAVIPTAQASGFTLQYFPYYV